MHEFELLLKQYQNALERFVKYKIQNTHDAEDIIQESCLAAYQNFDTLKNKEVFKTWLISIANYKCKDYFRKKAECLQIPLDELPESKLRIGGHGLTEVSIVRDTLSLLDTKDKQILYLYFFENLPQHEIAQRLDIPIGTVKSRLYYAKKNFKENYPLKSKGVLDMKNFPEIMPSYKITGTDLAPFTVKHEELPGMFIIPKVGEKCRFAMYDLSDYKQNGIYQLSVKGYVIIHGIKGVEIESEYKDAKSLEKNTIFAQLTDTHCRYLGGMDTDNNRTRRMVTFLDDDFADSYKIGEDNCGFPTERTCKGLFTETTNGLTCDLTNDVSDICGRFEVKIGQRTYDTVRLLDIQVTSLGVMLCEYYIDNTGHTVLWRRFNKNDWAFKRYQKNWTEILPDSERLIINGETYVHWYDCITDYVL